MSFSNTLTLLGTFFLSGSIGIGGAAVAHASPDALFPGKLHAAVGANAIAISDIDGDGFADLVVVDTAKRDVALIPGDGKGGFLPHRIIDSVDGLPRHCIAEDLNNDGAIDVAFVSYLTNTLTVLLNEGESFAESHYQVGSTPEHIDSSDLDGDGALDLVTVSVVGGYVSLFFGDGSGGFENGIQHDVGDSPQEVVCADINADGRPDLVTVNSESSDASVLINLGQRQFASATSHEVGLFPRHMDIADIDGDGVIELLVGHWGLHTEESPARVSIHAYESDQFIEVASFTLADNATGVQAVDWNNDGRTDVVVAQRSRITVLERQETGSMKQIDVFGGGDEVACGHMDGDAWLDFVIGAGDRLVGLLQGPGRGFDVRGGVIDGHGSFATADLNFDGECEVVAIQSDAEGAVALNVLSYDGEAFQVVHAVAIESIAQPPLVADFNHDQIPDVLVSSDFRPLVLFGNGANGFRGSVISHIPAVYPHHVVDVDGDGELDFVYVLTSNMVVHHGDRGAFGAAVQVELPFKSQAAGFADANGDGAADLIFVDRDQPVLHVLLNDEGVFTDSLPTQLPFVANALQLGDVNADGKVDVIVLVGGANTSWRVFLGNGQGGFELSDGKQSPHKLSSPEVFDVTADFIPDLVFSSTSSRAAVIYSGNGDGTFNDAQLFNTGQSPWRVLGCRMNGRTDLVVGDLEMIGHLPNLGPRACSGDLSGDASVNGLDLAVLLANWSGSAPIADLNGDGVINGADLAVLLANWGPC